jgi:hypothetical protein
MSLVKLDKNGRIRESWAEKEDYKVIADKLEKELDGK